MKTKKSNLKQKENRRGFKRASFICAVVAFTIFSCQKENELNSSEEALVTDTTLDFQQQREEEFVQNFVNVFGVFSRQEELLTEIGAADEPLLLDHILDVLGKESGTSSKMNRLALFNEELTKETNGMERTDVLFDLGASGEIDIENMLFAFLPVGDEDPYIAYDINGNRLGVQETETEKSVLFFDRYGWHSYLNEMDAINKAYVSEGALDTEVYAKVKAWQDMTEDQIEASLKAEMGRTAEKNTADILSIGKVKAKKLRGGNRRPEVYAVITGVDDNQKAMAINVPLKYIKAENVYNFPVGGINRKNGVTLAKWSDFDIETVNVIFFERNRKAGFFRQVINFVKGLLGILKKFELFQGTIFNNAEAFVAELDKVVPTARKDDLLDMFRINSKAGKPKTKGQPFPRKAVKLGTKKNMEVTFLNRKV